MKVLVTDSVFDGFEPEKRELDPLGVELVVSGSKDESELIELAGDVDGILVCFAQVGPPLIEVAAAGGCRIISRYGIGYDNVDVGAATAAGVRVTNVPDYCLDEVADHTMALLLDRARNLSASLAGVRAGGWEIDHARVRRVAGKRLALIGAGGIGSRVAGRARAFGLVVTIYDPYASTRDAHFEWADSVEEAVAAADYVSVHVPLTDENHHLIGEKVLAAMKPDAVVINTARGGLVDLEAVTTALEERRIGGLALDVTEPEPLPVDHPLRTNPDALITPHMAFHSVEATEELQTRAAGEVARALRGEPAENQVNRLAGDSG